MMLVIREYEEMDAIAVGILIAETYGEFNLDFATPEQRQAMLGPFQHAWSEEKAHRNEIAGMIRAEMVFVAVLDGEVAGVLRGRKDKLQSLFVSGRYHRKGIGRRLVARFEDECMRRGGEVIKLMATLYAVPFYEAVGYKKSTGVRRMRSFEGEGLPYQPMKKVLERGAAA